jgi:deoxycytidylate deaminase
MKTDHYLNLCLEQAAQSPLRYRHGCIIVRGGKVIGQGFNDHRAGFDGGALKTGRLPARSLDPAALAELKKKHKHKRGLANPSEEVATSFTPFEAMGGGKLANTPLSMHSEMMAIHSALSASTTLVSTAVSSKKPYFKLSGDSKRKCRVRRDAIKTYVETICKVALAQSTEQRFGRPVEEWRFESAAPQSDLLDRGAGSDERSCVSGVYGAQYGETPWEESKEPSTRERSSRDQWKTQATAQAVCA